MRECVGAQKLWAQDKGDPDMSHRLCVMRERASPFFLRMDPQGMKVGFGRGGGGGGLEERMMVVKGELHDADLHTGQGKDERGDERQEARSGERTPVNFSTSHTLLYTRDDT